MHQSFVPQAGWVFFGVLVILIAASSVGWYLEKKYGRDNGTIANLNARIHAWWLMSLVLLLAFWFNKLGTAVLFYLISFAALREFMALIYRRQSDYYVMVACFYLLLPLQYYFVLIEWYGMFSIFIPVYGFLFLPIIAGFSGKTEHFLARTAKTQWMAMICIYCLSHVPAVLFLHFKGIAPEQNIMLLIFMIGVVQMSDVLQYIWGKLLGGPKIMPKLSPSKTVSGTVGGIASASLLAAAASPLLPFTALQAGLIGFCICLMGFFGGLVMSAIKRDHGIKDWGKMLAGHGGMLDRVDSICFAAPVFFHIMRYYWNA